MKRIAILGATGSIGASTLAVVRQYPERFKAVALTAGSQAEKLCSLAREFKPAMVCVNDMAAFRRCAGRPGAGVKVYDGRQGLLEIVQDPSVDEVVMAISGAEALPPLLKAIESGKDVILANKEALAMAGPLVMAKAKRHKVSIKPVDSEQSAIWQCLHGQPRERLKRILLTASGGPFRGLPASRMKTITLAQALRHPRWQMGRKITIDSATLMNKGLELLEAMYLFGVPAKTVEVVVHPEAVIHSMVEFVDGVVMAQLSTTDMRVPIQYALTYPDRLPCASVPAVDFCTLGRMHFEKPDLRKFPCLALAYRAAQEEGTLPCVLNAANEVAVEGFMLGKVGFTGIPRVVEKVMDRHRVVRSPSLGEVMDADAWARVEAAEAVNLRSKRTCA